MALNFYKFGRNRRARRGVAVVEFLFAAPAFFVLLFFVIEIALVWSDRHVMRLAAYRAARTVIKMRAETQSPGAALCWRLPPNIDPQSKLIFKKARRSASKVMSTVTPSITQLLTMFGNPVDGKAIEKMIGDDVLQVFGDGMPVGDGVSAVGKNPYVHAIFRMMKGLPAAWIMTDLQCSDIQYPTAEGVKGNNGVELRLTYHRSAKMPYVGTIMWFLHKMQQLYEQQTGTFDGVSEMVRVNPLNYGIEFKFALDSSEYEMAKEQFANYLKDTLVKESKELADGALDKINEASSIGGVSVPSTLPTGDEVGESMGKIFDDIIAPKLKDKFDEFASQSQAVVNALGEKTLELFLMAPDELKTIPVTVSVRIPNYSQAFFNAGNPWDGKAMLVGKFAGGENMTSLAKTIGKALDEGQPPNSGSGKGLPYVGAPSP